MTNTSMDSNDAESQPLIGRNNNVNTPLTGHCYTETDADATIPATASQADYGFDFDPLGDVDNPLEWPIALKWGIVTLLALMAFTVYVLSLGSPSLLFPSLVVLLNPSIFCLFIFVPPFFSGNISPSPRTAPLHRDPRSGYRRLPRFRGPTRSEHRTEHENHPSHHLPLAVPRCTTLTHDPRLRCFPIKTTTVTPSRTLTLSPESSKQTPPPHQKEKS